MKNRACIAVLVLFTILGLLACADLAAALDIQRTVLPNGLTVILVERHELPIISVSALVTASPLGEDPAKAGIASLTAKMLTEGTATRTGPGISEEIEFIGGSLNAAANHDFTTVSLSILRKDADKGLGLLADVLCNPAFPEAELQRKKTLVAGSLKQREEEPSFIAERAFIRDIFGEGHAYGRQAEGSIESIASIGREDLTSFYRTYYLPRNVILVVVGDIKGKELQEIIQRHFSAWNPTSPPEKVAAGPPALPTHAAAHFEVIDRDISQANIMFGHAGIARSDPDYYSVSVMNYILGGGGFASRLMKTVRDDMGLTYSIHSFFMPQKYPGRFEVSVQTKNESAGVVVDEILKQIRRMRTETVTDQELADAKAYLIGSFPRRLDTGRKIAEFLTSVEFYGLGAGYIGKYKDYISKVTKEDVLRVARTYLNDTTYTLVIVGNQKKLSLDPAAK